MSWETELQDASFRGVPFECISTDDVHSKTLAIHQSLIQMMLKLKIWGMILVKFRFKQSLLVKHILPITTN
jgi:prophage DNA circulation protein